jgi:hypothetical protein
MRYYQLKKENKMRSKAIILLFSGFFILCFSLRSYAAQDFGIMMDVSGKVAIHRDGNPINADFGMNIFSGDIIELNKGSDAVIVSYADCQEWTLKGPDKVMIKTDEGPESGSGMVAPSRQLPVCYGPEEFKEDGSDVIGGLVLRGQPKDPLAALREEFKGGTASNSTLMTLIMHDLKNGKIERARPYFDTLKVRAPESEFINNIARRFKKE